MVRRRLLLPLVLAVSRFIGEDKIHFFGRVWQVDLTLGRRHLVSVVAVLEDLESVF